MPQDTVGAGDFGGIAVFRADDAPTIYQYERWVEGKTTVILLFLIGFKPRANDGLEQGLVGGRSEFPLVCICAEGEGVLVQGFGRVSFRVDGNGHEGDRDAFQLYFAKAGLHFLDRLIDLEAGLRALGVGEGEDHELTAQVFADELLTVLIDQVEGRRQLQAWQNLDRLNDFERDGRDHDHAKQTIQAVEKIFVHARMLSAIFCFFVTGSGFGWVDAV